MVCDVRGVDIWERVIVLKHFFNLDDAIDHCNVVFEQDYGYISVFVVKDYEVVYYRV